LIQREEKKYQASELASRPGHCPFPGFPSRRRVRASGRLVQRLLEEEKSKRNICREDPASARGRWPLARGLEDVEVCSRARAPRPLPCAAISSSLTRKKKCSVEANIF